MTDVFSQSLRLRQMGYDSNATTWGTRTNTNLDLIEDALTSATSINLAGGSHTLSTSNGSVDEARSPILLVGGTLINNRSIIVPSVPKLYWVLNDTTGSFTVTVKTSTQPGVVVERAANGSLLYCDGVNVSSLSSAGTGFGKLVELTNDSFGQPALPRVSGANLTNVGGKSGCSVYLGGLISIPPSTPTTVIFQVSTYDPGDWWQSGNGGIITIPDGISAVRCRAAIEKGQNVAAGIRITAAIHNNGFTQVGSALDEAGGWGILHLSTPVFEVSEGDELSLVVWHDNPMSMGLGNSSAPQPSTFLDVEAVG